MKTGRPKLKHTERKGEIIGVRFTVEERKRLEAVAAKSGNPLSQWARKSLLATACVHTNTLNDSAGKVDRADSQKRIIES